MAHKKKNDEHDDEKEVNLGIVITPMLDMAFQLLAFFVLTYHPAALEGHINGKLLPPEKIAIKGKSATEKKADASKITDDQPDTQDTVTIFIRAADRNEGEGDTKRIEGQPSQILLKTPEIQQPETVADSSDSLNTGLQKLFTRLKEIRSSPAGAGLVVRLQPDGNLRNEYVIRAWNVCKTAGFETIGFVAPPSDSSR
jgi:biopolymer transport protein ExbD